MSQVEIPDGAIDLGMGEWAVAKAGEFLETCGASTCGIVAVLNHSQRLAWMVHQPTPAMNAQDVIEMLDDALDAQMADDNVEIWVAGCVEEDAVPDRSALLSEIETRFSRINPIEMWTKDALCVRFDTDELHWKAC